MATSVCKYGGTSPAAIKAGRPEVYRLKLPQYGISTEKQLDQNHDSNGDHKKLVDLGVDPELLKNLNDEQIAELTSALLYLMMKKED